MKKIALLVGLFLLPLCAKAQEPTRWDLHQHSISWDATKGLPHEDFLEMSGEKISAILRWGVTASGEFRAERSLVFPCLRTIPNNTHGSLKMRLGNDPLRQLNIDGHTLMCEHTDSVVIDGMVKVYSRYALTNDFIGVRDEYAPVIQVIREFYPSAKQAAFYEKFIVRNISDDDKFIYIPESSQSIKTDPAKGVEGSYTVSCSIAGSGYFDFKAGSQLEFCAVYQAYVDEPVVTDFKADYLARRAYVDDTIASNLQLTTPDPVINEMFHFAKLRTSESIFNTKGGYLHGPGGEIYYAAIWANDQAEYANPFFPWLGYDIANESSINSFRHFARYMNDEYKPIPSSIIAEGLDYWNGAGDRGDAAMIAYGAARYALARGSKEEAEELLPLIEWCLEFCRRRINEQGVVFSDSDELEGRFPSGDYNLCTSTLYYDALISTSYLCKDLGLRRDYMKQARKLEKAIDKYFAANMGGFDCYRYYDGNTKLRSWICMPLIVGIHTRAAGTVDALLSPALLTENGLLTEEGSETFWDRSTLYAMRGIYYAGYPEEATKFLQFHSRRRLLGDHVPYSIEAWPEGSQKHLAAESALYCRVITEGLLGMRPSGMRSFFVKPSLPAAWDTVSLDHIRAFGADFDLKVTRIDGGKLKIEVVNGSSTKEYKIRTGQQLEIKL